MPFATAEDVAARLGRGTLTDDETTQAEALIRAATVAITSEVEQDDTWAEELDPVPGAIWQVTVELAVRTMRNPAALAAFSEQLGAVSRSETYKDTGGGLELTRSERKRVRRALGLFTFRPATLESPYSGGDVEDWPELPLS